MECLRSIPYVWEKSWWKIVVRYVCAPLAIEPDTVFLRCLKITTFTSLIILFRQFYLIYVLNMYKFRSTTYDSLCSRLSIIKLKLLTYANQGILRNMPRAFIILYLEFYYLLNLDINTVAVWDTVSNYIL